MHKTGILLLWLESTYCSHLLGDKGHQESFCHKCPLLAVQETALRDRKGAKVQLGNLCPRSSYSTVYLCPWARCFNSLSQFSHL